MTSVRALGLGLLALYAGVGVGFRSGGENLQGIPTGSASPVAFVSSWTSRIDSSCPPRSGEATESVRRRGSKRKAAGE
ncbi:unnamed protein product, partial [Discosporangium mesarthrocarpum]